MSHFTGARPCLSTSLTTISLFDVASVLQDGSTWMSEEFDVFASLDEVRYTTWKQRRANSSVPCVDGSEMVDDVRLVRAEVYSPSDATNKQTDVLTKAAIEVWCKGMLKTLKEGQSARYLSGGEFGIDKQTEEMKKHLKHT